MGLYCSSDGVLDESKFGKPIPWVGLYISGGSLLCALLMAVDTFLGFRNRKLWFPCKFFRLNAISLTLLSIATKLPVDLNTSMPRREDQLSKLSGVVLICTVMGNFMPSLGATSNYEMLSNVVALAILVITVIANVAIQMGTGAIYIFLPEHAVVMFFMLLLLVLMSSSALALCTTRSLLEKQYDQQYKQMSQIPLSSDDGVETFAAKNRKLRKDVMKFWMMAHTSSPQFVLGRSVTCTASGASCLLGALVLVEAVVRSFIPESVRFCNGESDYKWSVMLVFISQLIAVAVSTIAPPFRCFNAISFRDPERRNWRVRDEFRVETYWIQRLVEWKEHPLPYYLSNRHSRKIAYWLKDGLLDVFIRMQFTIVSLCKFMRLVSVFLMSRLNSFCCCCKRLPRRAQSIGSVSFDSGHNSDSDLSKFVFHLEGEEELVRMIMKNGSEAAEDWFQRATKNQPNRMINLLKMSSEALQGAGEFDSNLVPSLACEEPPNCWALPVVTLTSIAAALPYIDQTTRKSLLHGVDEGLKYVRLIEKKMDSKGLTNMRYAADIVWLGIDLHDRWLNEDLFRLAYEEKSAQKIIAKLATIGENYVAEFLKGGGQEKSTLEWPVKVLAGNSMYRIGQSILQDYNKKFATIDKLFEWLSMTITDILCACLTNLPRVVFMECICSPIEEREDSVREATYLLGECKSILRYLEQKVFLDMDSDSMADIEEWRKRTKTSASCHPPDSSSEELV